MDNKLNEQLRRFADLVYRDDREQVLSILEELYDYHHEDRESFDFLAETLKDAMDIREL